MRSPGLQAWIGKQAPPADLGSGFMYMLAGGTDASNTDPYATGPAAGNAWIETGPHVMIVGPAAMHAIGPVIRARRSRTPPSPMSCGRARPMST